MRELILNCPVDNLTMVETMDKVALAIEAQQQIHHVVVNAAKLVNMQSDEQLKEAVTACDIINADGQAVVWASRILKSPLKERVAGVDLMQNLVHFAHQKNYRIFFLGAKEEVVSKVVAIYSEKYTPDIIAGYRKGYFNSDEETEIAQSITNSGANILFVAISSPKKEIFLNRYKDILGPVNFIMGVGGSFDVVSGKVQRAPLWMQRTGLEWFYRVLQEPGRMWKRYLVTNSLFIWMVCKAKINQIFSGKKK